MTLLKFQSTDSVKWNSVKWLTKFWSSDKTQFRSTEIRSSDRFPFFWIYLKSIFSNYIIYFQGLPFAQTENFQELTGTWEKVFIPVLEPVNTFTAKETYTLRHIQVTKTLEDVLQNICWSQNLTNPNVT